MRYFVTAIALIGGLTLVPAGSFAATPGAQKSAATKESKRGAAATHATGGTVKSIDANTMVITRGGKDDMTFALNATTRRDGTVAVGSMVSVRYREDGASHVATAITVQQGKQTAARAPSTR